MKTLFNGLMLTSRYYGTKAMISDPSGESVSRHHKIYVFNTANNRAINFDFYPSIAHPSIDSSDQLVEALGCFLSDGQAASEYTLDDFASEFGYDASTPISQIIDTYDACHDSYCKALYLFEEDLDSLYDLNEAVSEAGY